MATASSSAHAVASHFVHVDYYDEAGEDLIYFTDDNLCHEKFVYNMKDGTVAPLAADGLEGKFRAPDCGLIDATWLFPPE